MSRRANRPHRVGHRDFMKDMTQIDLTPTVVSALRIIGQQRQDAASMKRVVWSLGFRPVKNRGNQVSERHHAGTDDSLVFHCRVANNQRDANSRFIVVCHCAGFGRAMIAGEDDKRLIRFARFVKGLQDGAGTRVHSTDQLVVARQAFSNFGTVGQVIRNDDVLRIVFDRRDTIVVSLDAPARPFDGRGMRVAIPDDQKERFVVLIDELRARSGQSHHVATAHSRIEGQRILTERCDVLLAEQRCAVAVVRQQLKHSSHLGHQPKCVIAVSVSVLTVRVTVKPSVNHSSHGSARGGWSKRVTELHAFLR